MGQLNVIQSLLKAKDVLFQQLAFLTERTDVLSIRLDSLESNYQTLCENFEEIARQDMEVKEWLEEKMLNTEDISKLDEDTADE
tara:strand:+ start:90 stop:341 length:252 start_codon:yes stop_codon:yes gene_type:complete